MANSLDNDYQKLLKQVLTRGVDKKDRTGTGTKSTFGATIRHDMSDGFPILTTKKIAFKTMVTELKWFLRGDTNIKYLVDRGCNIWNGDAYKRYFKLQVPHDHFETQEEFIELIKTNDEFAKKWGELGPIYGKQWRNWGTGETVTVGHNGSHTLLGEKVIDQIQDLISELKTNPDSRRLMVNAWNVGQLHEMTLPPCHYGFQVYTRELSLPEREKLCSNLGATWDLPFTEKVANKWNVPTRSLSLMWNQRSADLFLGVPFNISSYGLLLLLLCKETGYEPGELIGNFGDVHLYKNHIEQAEEQIDRYSYDLPEVKLSCYDIYRGDFDVELINYKSHPAIKAPLSN
jgi:thymidylate synthase